MMDRNRGTNPSHVQVPDNVALGLQLEVQLCEGVFDSSDWAVLLLLPFVVLGSGQQEE